MHPVVVVVMCVLIFLFLFIIADILFHGRAEREHRLVLEGKVDEISVLNAELEEKQKSLEEACQQAEEANSAKSTFLFNMSHDIRTPMNAIIGFTELLRKHQEEPEKRNDYLNKIQSSSTVLLSIINNVLEMSRIEKGTLEMDETAWSAEQFNDTLYSVFQDMMEKKGIEFTRELAVEHHYVFCDPIKLREVFLNILSNAYKYTNSGGKIHMQLEEIPCEREGYALYQTTISDTGMGMDKEFLPHIFEEFSRENNSTDNKIEGTGLGMPIVKRLVDFMEGTIEVESEKGKGSRVTVRIPHRIADRADLVDHAGIKLDPSVFVGKRILLAEDNELNAEIAIEILTEAGFEVERAADGQLCVDMLTKAETGYYSVILMDIQMPNMNGYEATKMIRALEDKEKAEIPILAMTANAFEEDKREAYHSGMNGHIAKPINVNEMMKTLTGILK
jgi:signal transduction histidine kinase